MTATNTETAEPAEAAAAPEVLTAIEVGELLRLTPNHVRRLALAGDLPGRRLGGTWRFNRAAIVALLPAAG